MRQRSSKQFAITVIDELPAAQEAELREELRVLGSPNRRGELAMANLHFLSCTIGEPNEQKQRYVILELCVDGAPNAFLERLVDEKERLIRAIFSSCTGFRKNNPVKPKELIAYLRRHCRKHITFHRGNPGRSVKQIQEEEEFLLAVRRSKSECAGRARSRQELWNDINGRLKDEYAPLLKRTPRRPVRVAWNVADSQTHSRFVRLLRWLAQSIFVALGVWFAYQEVRAPGYGRWFVIALPVISMLWRLWCDIVESPRHLKLPARIPVITRIVVATLRDGIFVLAFCGILVGVYSADWAELRPILIWMLALFLAALFPLSGALLGYLSAGRPGLWLGIGIGAGLMALSASKASAEAVGLVSTIDAFATQLGLVALVILLALTGWTLGVMFWLRSQESDDFVSTSGPSKSHLDIVTKHEDLVPQNHFASITRIKPGWLRLRILKAVLRLIHTASYFIFNLGYLGGIPAIHFARFVLLPGDRELLFLSNYDGGFDSYLATFSKSSGVTAVWGQTYGFPRPFFLLFRGARDEAQFTDHARVSQIETLIWFSAYPSLSVEQIDNASATRRDLLRPLDTRKKSYWSEVRRIFQRPLAETDLALGINRMG